MTSTLMHIQKSFTTPPRLSEQPAGQAEGAVSAESTMFTRCVKRQSSWIRRL